MTTRKATARKKPKPKRPKRPPAYSDQSKVASFADCIEFKMTKRILQIKPPKDVPVDVAMQFTGEDCETLINCVWDGQQWIC